MLDSGRCKNEISLIDAIIAKSESGCQPQDEGAKAIWLANYLEGLK